MLHDELGTLGSAGGGGGKNHETDISWKTRVDSFFSGFLVMFTLNGT